MHRLLNEWSGFAVRITYAFVQIIALGAEVTAVAIYCSTWFPAVTQRVLGSRSFGGPYSASTPCRSATSRNSNTGSQSATICIRKYLDSLIPRAFKRRARRPPPTSWLRYQIHSTDISGLRFSNGLSIREAVFTPTSIRDWRTPGGPIDLCCSVHCVRTVS